MATLVQRLAVLLAAGVPPASAWGYLGEEAGPPPLAQVVRAIGARTPVEQAVLEGAGAADGAGSTGWRGLAAAWTVATDAGAPLASTLGDLAAALRDLAQTQREIQVALAAPIATSRMVMALPAIGVLFGMLLGFDTVGTLFGTPIGLTCLATGAGLVLAARAWSRRLVRAAVPAAHPVGLALDLVAIAVSGGASTERAAGSVRAACERGGIATEPDRAAVDTVLSLSRRAGVPAAALLRAEAAESRRRARSDGARSAATLSVTLMLPLGLCILPAFMLLGVAPLMVAVISSTVAGF